MLVLDGELRVIVGGDDDTAGPGHRRGPAQAASPRRCRHHRSAHVASVLHTHWEFEQIRRRGRPTPPQTRPPTPRTPRTTRPLAGLARASPATAFLAPPPQTLRPRPGYYLPPGCKATCTYAPGFSLGLALVQRISFTAWPRPPLGSLRSPMVSRRRLSRVLLMGTGGWFRNGAARQAKATSAPADKPSARRSQTRCPRTPIRKKGGRVSGNRPR